MQRFVLAVDGILIACRLRIAYDLHSTLICPEADSSFAQQGETRAVFRTRDFKLNPNNLICVQTPSRFQSGTDPFDSTKPRDGLAGGIGLVFRRLQGCTAGVMRGKTNAIKCTQHRV